ncbi:MAG TPA: hypothetical protein VNX68_01605 [Nitrosopumilaceae archaeon]|nr:hypothetical protein [Nitrosopumilaceae archaeon]
MSTNAAHVILDDTSVTLENLCESILYASENIQSVVVINKNGRPVEEKARDDSDLLSDKKNEMYFMQCALQMSMAKDFDEEFGPVSFTITERENSKFVSIPSFSHIILAKMKRGMDQAALLNKIKKIIRNFEAHNSELSVRKGGQI